VSNAPERSLPADVAREIPDDGERAALETVWAALDGARPAASVTPAETSAMWAAIVAGTSQAVPAPASRPAPSVPGITARRNQPAWARRRPSASTLITLAFACAALFTARPGSWQVVEVPLAQQRVISLPDGSEATLHAGTRLRYRDGFRGWFWRAADRRLELEGAAYFDVVSDGRSFSVRTYNASVRVLGTEFEVQSWSGDRTGTAVTVAEGRVALAGSTGDAVTLVVGQRAVVLHAATAPESARDFSAERVAPWRSGGFVAVDEPLANVVATLERQFDTVIELDEPSIGAQRISLYYPDIALDRVLGDVATMQSLTLERRRDGYLLRRP
jgi:ferric-dicitrate binding protein FerR (iron transport regulator)